MPISLAFLDIDNFLQINQAFDHNGGDQVLQNISAILCAHAGEQAITARYGGDDFAIIFPNTEREQAFLTMERIRAQVETQEMFVDVHTRITITGGIDITNSAFRSACCDPLGNQF